MSSKIKTNIKFYKGLNNVSEQLYGFVVKVGNSWRGCREEAPKKKLVLVEHHLNSTIVPNALYKCTLVPMRNGHGFVVQSAKLVQFPALIKTKYEKGSFEVTVSFGIKSYHYNPTSTNPAYNNIKWIADKLRSRIDLKDSWSVAESFIDHALAAKRMSETGK